MLILEYLDLPIPLKDLYDVISEKSPEFLPTIWCYENIEGLTIELDFSFFLSLAF